MDREVSFSFFVTICLLCITVSQCSMASDLEKIAKHTAALIGKAE